MRMASFDVFDTLLIRTVAEPRDLFLLLGELSQKEGWVAVEPRHFAQTRVEAEVAARGLTAHGEVNLEEIYFQLCLRMSLSDQTQAKIKRLELALEEESIRAVPGMAARVEAARKDADQIAFISDMYLPAEFVRRMLRREGFFQDTDHLYMSHEWSASKATGQLFHLIKKNSPVEIKQWRHVGDNVEADVEKPRQHGIEAEQFSLARLTRYEDLVRGKEGGVVTWRSKLAAAMRLTRLQNAETDSHRSVIWDTTCDVVAPLLFGFVLWCLHEAKTRKLQRLYFVSRDGQILQRLAQVIAPAWGYTIECRYLYGSRKAWHPATLEKLNAATLKSFFETAPLNSLRKVFALLDLSIDSFEQVLDTAGFGRARWDEHLDREEQGFVQQLFLKSPIAEAIVSNSRKKRELAISYLEQERFLDGVPAAIVDIGWYGNLQRSLTEILTLAGHRCEVTGFYFGLLAKNRLSAESNYLSYWNQLSEARFRIREQNLAMFELFTAGTHGSVMGYEQMGEKIRPVLNHSRNLAAEEWGLHILQQAACQFASVLLTAINRESLPVPEYRQITARVYDLFYKHPSKEEARVWGSFKYSEDPSESSVEQMVPDWNWRQIVSALLNWKKRPTYWWHHGSLATRNFLPLRLYLQIRAFTRLLTGGE
jgi:predicted HAD superfamily hydrolase